MKSSGAILGYAGSSNDRAQATLDCIIGEIHRLAKGITHGGIGSGQDWFEGWDDHAGGIDIGAGGDDCT